MTRSRLNAMIKQAGKSAKDKAMATAALLGKPTSTGIAAGAGLGAILAAAGALSRSGEDPSDVSILSNPLLLGTLGTAGGYLAGNAFENMPTDRSHKNISGLALLSLLGGTGTLGTMLAKEDAKELLHGIRDMNGNHITQNGKALSIGAKKTFDDITERLSRSGNLDFSPDRSFNGHRIRNFDTGKLIDPSERAKFNEAQDNYIKALKRTGNYRDAMREGGFIPSESVVKSLVDRIANHPLSPVSWVRAPLSLAARGSLRRALLGPGGIARRGSAVQIGNLLRRPGSRAAAGLAALALLAGGGKAVYDKVHD